MRCSTSVSNQRHTHTPQKHPQQNVSTSNPATRTRIILHHQVGLPQKERQGQTFKNQPHRVKKKTMTGSVDREKVFYKIQQPLMIKTQRTRSRKGTSSTLRTKSLQLTTTLTQWEDTECFQKTGNKASMSAARQEKETKGRNKTDLIYKQHDYLNRKSPETYFKTSHN